MRTERARMALLTTALLLPGLVGAVPAGDIAAAGKGHTGTVPEEGTLPTAVCMEAVGCVDVPLLVDEHGDTMTGDLTMDADVVLRPGHRVRFALDDSTIDSDTGGIIVNGTHSVELRAFNMRALSSTWSTAGNGIITIIGSSANSVAPDAGASTVAGGDANTIRGGRNHFIGAGDNNTVTTFDSGAFVGAGRRNTAASAASGVVAGADNLAAGTSAVVAGGLSNKASGFGSFVGGGILNVASGNFSFVGGGIGNVASGVNSGVGAGRQNIAAGENSWAGGTHTNANSDGAFVWASGNGVDVVSPSSNTFTVLATGGTTFYSDTGATAGVRLAGGSGSWSTLSDRAMKEGVEPADARDVLARVAAMPINEWSYTTQPGVRHMGPMAQDFAAAFGLGEDERRISGVDADGVALAAIQGLWVELEEERARNDALEARLAALEAALAAP